MANKDTKQLELVEKMEQMKVDEISQIKYKEGGWGWFVVISCAINFGLNIGFINCYALIYTQFIDNYNSTENYKVYAAWIGASSNGIQFFFCPFSGILIDMFTARKVGFFSGLLSSLGLCLSAIITDIRLYFITYSVMLGIGQALLLNSTLSILPQYFNKRLGLANGLMIFGGTIITTTLPFIFEAILESYGIYETFYILAAIMLLTSFSSLTFKNVLLKTNHESFRARLKDGLGLQVFKIKKFIYWIVGTFIAYLGVFTPIVALNNESRNKFPDYSPSILFSIIGCICGIFAIIFGKLSDHITMHPINFLIIGFTISSIAQILLPFITQFWQLCCICVLIGTCDSFALTFIVPISFAITKSPKLSNQAIGYYFLAISIPSMVGPTVLVGWIFDKYSSYEYSYYISGAFCFSSALFLFIFFPDGIIRKKIMRNKNTISESSEYLYKF